VQSLAVWRAYLTVSKKAARAVIKLDQSGAKAAARSTPGGREVDADDLTAESDSGLGWFGGASDRTDEGFCYCIAPRHRRGGGYCSSPGITHGGFSRVDGQGQLLELREAQQFALAPLRSACFEILAKKALASVDASSCISSRESPPDRGASREELWWVREDRISASDRITKNLRLLGWADFRIVGCSQGSASDKTQPRHRRPSDNAQPREGGRAEHVLWG
jgi:hypothetical protein